MKKATKRPSGRRRGSGKGAPNQHSSHPTGRYAYVETRRWLLEQHGPVCAYCGVRRTADDMTLDHVTPRRGLTAYDRRDNLVLCCKRCNSAKADKAFLTYLIAQRGRAVNLLRYGAHLSHGILDLVRHMAGDAAEQDVTGSITPRVVYGPDDDGDSPYLDSPYRESA
ncbi:MAG: HNH endonuclease [Gemmatimonadaceae bacterium]